MFLNRAEVAQRLGCKPNTLSWKCSKGDFPRPDKIERQQGLRKRFFWKNETVEEYLVKKKKQDMRIQKAKSEKEIINQMLNNGDTYQDVADFYRVSISLIRTLKVKPKKPTPNSSAFINREFKPPRFWALANEAFNQTIKA